MIPLVPQDFEVPEQIPLTPSDSEKSLSEEEEVPGSIPVPLATASPPIFASGSARTKRAISKSHLLTETMFSVTDDTRMYLDTADAAPRQIQNFSSTVPVFQDFAKRYLADRPG